ncbi:1,4-alpha-glucan branching protein GlgB [Kibdelosporangium philippinense]|uniref:1,4-alpha-glucan branching enzyme GlgB n=1 Tax=Kibdelosporangium philippinense TaxID=211113 RepID=A0ABS8ZH84_9PSEU|nr:1,4-alpha-glucan branching protein GlgB [Kibdelosporangium philippinense]MCE7007186.1 1,4-alpha-glucan branching protein GlgB [Kibdelosporangium philippinense]
MTTSILDIGAPDTIQVDRLLSGTHRNPHRVLGSHPRPSGTLVRALKPGASSVAVITKDDRYDLSPVRDGLFSGVVPVRLADYRFEVTYSDRVELADDPYRWLPTLGEFDLHLISEGRHERLWDVLGAHVTTIGGVSGTAFAVWAPNAQAVQVLDLPMRRMDPGVWKLFVPGVTAGQRYRFRILGSDGQWRDKADPLAFAADLPSSVVHSSDYVWQDSDWLATRDSTDWSRSPVSIYEVHLGSWRPGLDYRELALQLSEYVTSQGFTHVELLPVAEHPYGGSWGYQVTSYYAPTSRFGTPDDFKYFVDTLHANGIGVIMDWVPAHFPRDDWALARFDGQPLYEHPDPRKGEHPDWGTLIFDYARPEVRNFLVANALFWLAEYHIDGLRVDAVASMLYLDYSRPAGEWVPNPHGGRENLDAVQFLQELNATAYKNHPGVMMIAEDSTTWPGVTRPTDYDGLGFGFKWNMGWMHDDLRYFSRPSRSSWQDEITFSLSYAWSENFILALSHDEVVHGKGSLWERMPGDTSAKAASLRSLLAFMWAHPGKQLLFMGGEFGQRAEWSEFGLDWHLLNDPVHAGIHQLVADLNSRYRSTKALHTNDTSPDGFTWLDVTGDVVAFQRDGDGPTLVCVANLGPTFYESYRIGLPRHGRWREVINTDSAAYHGSNIGNGGSVTTEPVPYHGCLASATLTLPPLGVLWLMPEINADL